MRKKLGLIQLELEEDSKLVSELLETMHLTGWWRPQKVIINSPSVSIINPKCSLYLDLTRKQPCITTLSSERRTKDWKIIIFLWTVGQLLPYTGLPYLTSAPSLREQFICLFRAVTCILLKGRIRKEVWDLFSCWFIDCITHRIHSFRWRLHKYFLLAEFILSRLWSINIGGFLRRAYKSVCFCGRTESCFQTTDGSKVILFFT